MHRQTLLKREANYSGCDTVNDSCQHFTKPQQWRYLNVAVAMAAAAVANVEKQQACKKV